MVCSQTFPIETGNKGKANLYNKSGQKGDLYLFSDLSNRNREQGKANLNNKSEQKGDLYLFSDLSNRNREQGKANLYNKSEQKGDFICSQTFPIETGNRGRQTSITNQNTKVISGLSNTNREQAMLETCPK